MSREIQPVYGQGSEPRTLDPVYIKGRQGGEYMMAPEFSSPGEATGQWVVRGKWGQEGGYVRLAAFEFGVATRVLDYCVANDANARTALHKLYVEGEPDFLLELVEKAKVEESCEYCPRFKVAFAVTVKAPRDKYIDRARLKLINEVLTKLPKDIEQYGGVVYVEGGPIV